MAPKISIQTPERDETSSPQSCEIIWQRDFKNIIKDRNQLTLSPRKKDELVGASSNHTSPLEAEGFLWLGAGEEVTDVKCEGGFDASLMT